MKGSFHKAQKKVVAVTARGLLHTTNWVMKLRHLSVNMNSAFTEEMPNDCLVPTFTHSLPTHTNSEDKHTVSAHEEQYSWRRIDMDCSRNRMRFGGWVT